MNSPTFIFEANPQNFQAEVIDRSKQVPVVVLFWAAQVAPAAEARNTLERLAGQHQGKVALALVDVAADQSLAQHLRVQGLPSLRVIKDGQMVDQLEGPQPESALVALLDGLTLSSGDLLKSQLAGLLDSADLDGALQLLQQAISEEPNNHAFRVELADVLILRGDLADARQALAEIPDDTAEVERPRCRLEILEEAAGYGDQAAAAKSYADDPEDLELCYQLAVLEASAGNYEAALDLAMSILQRNREFRDDIGRTTMIRIFNLLGQRSATATAYRRRMFNFMH